MFLSGDSGLDWGGGDKEHLAVDLNVVEDVEWG